MYAYPALVNFRSDVEAHIKSVHPDSDASVFVLRKPISCEGMYTFLFVPHLCVAL